MRATLPPLWERAMRATVARMAGSHRACFPSMAGSHKAFFPCKAGCHRAGSHMPLVKFDHLYRANRLKISLPAKKLVTCSIFRIRHAFHEGESGT